MINDLSNIKCSVDASIARVIEDACIKSDDSSGDVQSISCHFGGVGQSEYVDSEDVANNLPPQSLTDKDVEEWESLIPSLDDGGHLGDSFHLNFEQSLDLSSGSPSKVVQVKIGPQHFDLLHLIGEGMCDTFHLALYRFITEFI